MLLDSRLSFQNIACKEKLKCPPCSHGKRKQTLFPCKHISRGFFLKCLSQQHWGSMSLMSHHTVTTTAAEQGQQLQAQAVVQGILYPGCWLWACSRLGSTAAKTPNAAPPHHPSQCPVPVPGDTLCHLGSERPFSGLTEIKPRARAPKVGLLSPGPALAVIPPAQEPLHAAAAAPMLFRAVWGAAAGHGSARPGASEGVGRAGSQGWTLLGSTSACLFSRADAACLI